jgi:hypothetical protein
MRVGDDGNSLVGVTIRQEKFLFISRSTFHELSSAIESSGAEGIQDWFPLSDRVRFLLDQSPEGPPAALLGLETDWDDLPDGTANRILDKFYSQAPDRLVISSEIRGRDMQFLVTAGAASAKIGVDPNEVNKAIAEIEQLKKFVEEADARGDDPKTIADGLEAAAGAIGQGSTITGAAATCALGATGGLAGGPAVAAAACLGSFILGLLGFKGWLDSMKQQQELEKKEQMLRDRDRTSSRDQAGVDMDRIDRISRTC